MDDKQNEVKNDIDVFKNLMSRRYSPKQDLVHREQCFRSSRDLMKEYEDFCEPTLADISKCMLELQYTFDSSHWICWSEERGEV